MDWRAACVSAIAPMCFSRPSASKIAEPTVDMLATESNSLELGLEDKDGVGEGEISTKRASMAADSFTNSQAATTALCMDSCA